MDAPQLTTKNFYSKACIFEASLIPVALLSGWISGINPFANLHFSESALGVAIIATLPLFGVFLVLQQVRIESVTAIRNMLLQTLGANLHAHHWTDLFILAAIAGVSEELLFRGVIQPWLEGAYGMMPGLIASNVLFGLVHAVTPLYALLAGLVGVYLGMALDYGGERNLLIPIVIHGLYDFMAFVALLRAYRQAL